MTKSSDPKNEYNEVENKIFESFKKYIESAKSKFQDNNSSKEIKHFKVYNFDNKTKIEELENEQEFSQLLNDSMKIESPFVNSNTIIKIKNCEGYSWKSPIENFFRRSSCYLDIINKRDIDFDLLFSDYLKSLKKEKTRITYFALVESVYFSKESMDFGSFKIRRFNASELDTIFNSAINKIFYPFAKIDSKRLQDYWFVCVDVDEIFTKFSPKPLSNSYKVKLEHSKFEKPLELALKKLSLFDWQSDFVQDSIPYVFKVNDNLLGVPSRTDFNLNQLETYTSSDPCTNEEIERPFFSAHLNNKEAERFEKFMLKIEEIFNMISLENKELKFIDNALGYFIKACVSQGMEQLLWYISAIEALLGDEADGITSNLARRSALITASTREDRKNARKKFKDLYRFRSKLVHGSIPNDKVYVEHLSDARDMSRRIILWFLYFIYNSYNSMQDTDKQETSLKREDILDTIDLEPEDIRDFIAT